VDEDPLDALDNHIEARNTEKKENTGELNYHYSFY
jgi:hypothetical protein